jgi:putative transposase
MLAPPFVLTPSQMRRLSPHFPGSHGVPSMDDCRVVSGIVYVIRHGLQWRDALVAKGPDRTLYNHLARLSRLRGCDSGMLPCRVAGQGHQPPHTFNAQPEDPYHA